MKTRAVYFIVGLLFASLISESLSICDDSVEVLADVCSRLNHQIETALLEDAGNAYRLRKAFFYAPNSHPVLIKVVCNVTFARNVTKDTQLQQNYCIDNADSNNTITAMNSTTIVLGWTSSGVFTAGQQNTGIILDYRNVHLVGFSLPEVQVTPTGVRYGSRIPFYIFCREHNRTLCDMHYSMQFSLLHLKPTTKG